MKTEKEMFETNKTNENENIEKKNERKVSFLDLLSENANSNKSWRSVRQNRRKKKAESSIDLKDQKTILPFFRKKSPELAAKTKSEKTKLEKEISFELGTSGTQKKIRKKEG